MLHSHIRIWIHLVWSTKKRKRYFVNNDIRKKLSEHIINKAKEEKIPFINLNIQPEHIHGLINLPSNICLATFMKILKGESSFWLNNDMFSETKFSWQRGYGAYSVSASQFNIVKNYIVNQDKHHKTKSFIKEYNEWKNKYGFFDDEI